MSLQNENRATITLPEMPWNELKFVEKITFQSALLCEIKQAESRDWTPDMNTFNRRHYQYDWPLLECSMILLTYLVEFYYATKEFSLYQFVRREEKKGIKDGSNKSLFSYGKLRVASPFTCHSSTLRKPFPLWRLPPSLRAKPFISKCVPPTLHFHANETLPQTAMYYDAQSSERRFLNGWRSLWPKSGMVSHVLVPINAMNSCVIQITVMTKTFCH